MREWKEGDRARAAEVAAAARKSQEEDAAVLRAKRVLAKPGNKHHRSGRAPAATAAVAPYSSAVPAFVAAGTPYKALGPYPAADAAETPAQVPGRYFVAKPTPRPSPPTGLGPASFSDALPAEGAHVTDAGNHPAAAATKFLGAPPADTLRAPPAAAVARPAAATPTISKDGAFLDSSVHCMAAVDRSAYFGTYRAGQVVAAALAVLSQLPDRRLSVRDARGKTGPVSYFTQHLTVIVRALCDALRSADASTSERVLWPIPSEYADDWANRVVNLNRARDGGGGDDDGRDRRGGGGSDGRDHRGGGSGRNHHGGSGHSSGGGRNGCRMGSMHRGKGGGGHSRSSGGKSSRQTRVGGLVTAPRAHPPTLRRGGKLGHPPPHVKVVQPLKR